MALDPQLLEILACPDEKGPLYYFEADNFLYCPKCRRRYEVRDDIPNMLIDEAEQLDEAAGKAIVDRAGSEGVKPTFEA
jgi:uncharacterized protein YbaR (Trm112 family)